MSRRILLAILLVVSMLGSTAATTRAVPQPPMVGAFTPEALQVARDEIEFAVPADGHTWEDQEEMKADQDFFSRPLTLNSTDDDACHYARGSTAVIHVFVSHTGGTWDSNGRLTMSARARTAKDHYLSIAPAGANLHFDHDGGNAYYYYETTLNQNIPDSGMTSALMETVASQIGFGDTDGDGSRIDDWSLYLMDFDGGWDNVILCFHPKQTGRAWASYGHAKCALYSDDTGNVFAHEWGHLFGACDEYVEGGECNGGIDCGACQSAYLDDIINNGNCQLVSCPSDVSCLMINNTFSNVCNYTLNHWGWVDEDGDGLLDWTKRRTTGNNFVEIYLIPHNGYALWNNVTDGYVIAQQWNTWSVAGLRPPSGSDYDLKMYGEFNHNYLLAGSSYGGDAVDFIVSDYNHDRPGNEHLQASLYTGPANNYRLSWESGTGMLYPDGVERAGTWSSYQVVRAWDVPLFGGEAVTFTLDVTSGSTDFGMALFKSNGSVYHVGRASAQWTRDAGGAGVTETYTYDVPSDDVYGLVIFANNAADSDFTIQIGPTPYTLSEEVPFSSSLDLRLFNYAPNAFNWSFAGSRPESGTNVTTRLFADSNYQTELATSDNYAEVEFVAADYNPSYSTDYLRVIRTGGTGTHRTEWEHDADLISGVVSESWAAGHVGKVWDCNLAGGQDYFFREYHTTGGTLDTGIYLFSSADGNRYKPRNAYDGASNFRPASDGGEWFHYTPSVTDWYGFYQIVNDESSGSYSVWMGPYFDLAEDEQIRPTDEVSFVRANVPAGYWGVFAVRPYFADNASIWLYTDDAYTSTSLKASEQSNARVPFIVGDFNHNAPGAVYPRVRRTTGGAQGYDVEWESGSEAFTYSGTEIVSDQVWPVHDVVEVFDLFVSAGQTLHIQVSDLNGQVDPGIAVFKSNNGEYWATLSGAVVSSDVTGTGGSEEVTYTFPQSDWYGLVIWSKDDVDGGGQYRIRIEDPLTSGVEPAPAIGFSLAAVSPNPFSGSATLQYSLARAARAELSIFDPQGRRVRGLVADQVAAGRHTAVWDGRDEQGSKAPSGVYFARLVSDEGERRIKLVRSQ